MPHYPAFSIPEGLLVTALDLPVLSVFLSVYQHLIVLFPALPLNLLSGLSCMTFQINILTCKMEVLLLLA